MIKIHEVPEFKQRALERQKFIHLQYSETNPHEKYNDVGRGEFLTSNLVIFHINMLTQHCIIVLWKLLKTQRYNLKRDVPFYISSQCVRLVQLFLDVIHIFLTIADDDVRRDHRHKTAWGIDNLYSQPGESTISILTRGIKIKKTQSYCPPS